MNKRELLRYFWLFPFIPMTASADASGLSAQANAFIGKVMDNIINPLVTVGFALAVVYLAWAIFQYTVNADKLDKDKLKNALVYGVVGVTIMATVFGIMRLIAVTITGDTSVVTNNV